MYDLQYIRKHKRFHPLMNKLNHSHTIDWSLFRLCIAIMTTGIGSDIGALLSPMGTLATLIWMYILKLNNIKVTWGKYFKVIIRVIPLGTIVIQHDQKKWRKKRR
jgi:Na+/H+ antiporter NhaD/arsenite permease-like protein